LRAKNLPALNMPPAPERILVRGLNWLGDAVMSTPALLRLREARPGARLVLLSPEKLAGLWQGQGCVDEVLTFSGAETLWRVSRRLRRGNFGIGIALPNSLRSALELWLAGIPVRIGRAGAGRGLLLTQAIGPRPGAVEMRKRTRGEIQWLIAGAGTAETMPPSAHHVHHYLHLAAALGASAEPLAPRIDLSRGEVEEARGKFGLARVQGRPWFGLNPGAEYGPAKRWPAEGFVAAAQALQRQTNCRWAVFGGVGDRELAENIARQAGEGALSLAGKTGLRELGAALKICDLVLTNDSGPMHLAAAVGTRVVAIFGSTSPELTGPVFSPRARIVRQPAPCAPCFLRQCPIDLRCLNGIRPESVVATALELIAAT
jgi:heptosyltransferase-2